MAISEYGIVIVSHLLLLKLSAAASFTLAVGVKTVNVYMWLAHLRNWVPDTSR